MEHAYETQGPRLEGYDYAQSGAYFLTIVTKDRELIFEDHALADMVERHWRWLAERYKHIYLDEFIVMPNHVHGIVLIGERPGVRSRTPPTDAPAPKAVGSLVGAFKTVSTQEVNKLRGTIGAQLWQRNYYDHIIRGDEDLNRIREYIIDNPRKWDEDPENPYARLP